MVRDGAGAPPHLLTVRVMEFGARPFLRHCERSEAIQKWIRGDSLDCFVASLLAMTMHQIAATQTDDPGHQTHLRILAACFARALFQLLTPFPERGRREDRVPAAPMAPVLNVAQAMHRGRPQVSRNNPAFPAQWFDGLCRALLGDEFLFVTVASRIGGESQHRSGDFASARAWQ